MKQIFTIISMLTLCCGATFAAEGDIFIVDGLNYIVRSEAERTVMVSSFQNEPTEVSIPASVNREGVEYAVIGVDEMAFVECLSLKSVSLPQTAKVINFGAFSNCTSLESVEMPSTLEEIGNSAFYGCESLKSIVLPEALKSIEGSTFSQCLSLDRVTIPDGVISIGYFAFSSCKGLKHVKIGANVTDIALFAFDGCNSLEEFEVDNANIAYMSPDGVLISKQDGTLMNYPLGNKRESYIMPESVTVISDNAFAECAHIKEIIMPNTVTFISGGAFYGCSALEKVDLGNSLTYIGGGAFANCTSLKEMFIPASVTELANEVFFNCPSVTSYTVAEDNQNYTDVEGVIFNKEVSSLYQYPANNARTSYTVPSTVETIEAHSMRGCRNLVSIVVPDNVQTIMEAAFYECDALEEIRLSESIEIIDHFLLFGCKSLKYLAIPAKVNTIGTQALYDCSNIGFIYSYPQAPPAVLIESFMGLPDDVVVYVPDEAVEVYKSDIEWGLFNDIRPMSVSVDSPDTYSSQKVEVYNLQGVRVASNSQEMTKLPAGIYIVNGKKVIKN